MTEQVIDAELRVRVVDQIGQLLPRILKRESVPVVEDAKLFDELGMTSASTLELLLELEEALEIQVDVEDIGEPDLETLGTLASFVASHAIVDD